MAFTIMYLLPWAQILALQADAWTVQGGNWLGRQYNEALVHEKFKRLGILFIERWYLFARHLTAARPGFNICHIAFIFG